MEHVATIDVATVNVSAVNVAPVNITAVNVATGLVLPRRPGVPGHCRPATGCGCCIRIRACHSGGSVFCQRRRSCCGSGVAAVDWR